MGDQPTEANARNRAEREYELTGEEKEEAKVVRVSHDARACNALSSGKEGQSGQKVRVTIVIGKGVGQAKFVSEKKRWLRRLVSPILQICWRRT